MDKHIFMAYDIRGIYPTELNEDDAYRIGRAYADFFFSSKLVRKNIFSVGHDMRLSSEPLKKSLISGMLDGGLNVVDIGLVPTPVLYFSVANGLDGGVMITASHNPPEWNGFKLQKSGALPVYNGDVSKIGELAMGGSFNERDRGELTKKDYVEDYVNYLSNKFDLNLSVALDIGNGAFGEIPRRVFENVGCSVEAIFERPDGTFPNHIADPHKIETLGTLRKVVSERGLDVGFAFDGDGDRLGVVDEKGNVVPSDLVLMMLAREALKRKNGNVVVDVRSSMALIEDIVSHGGNPIMWKCGHAYILDKIFETNAVFGGEITGHMYFPLDYFPYDDGLFMALEVAKIVGDLKSRGETLSEYVSSLPRYISSKEYSFSCDNDKKFEIVKRISEDAKKLYKVIDIDGVRIELGDSWGIIRASNTSPKIKCRFESKTERGFDEIKKIIFGFLKKYGVVNE